MEEETTQPDVSPEQGGDLLSEMGNMFQEEIEAKAPPPVEQKPEPEPEKEETTIVSEEEIDASNVPEEASDSPDAEDEGQTLETLDDLKEYIGVESLDELRVRTKVDGVEGEATLGDVLKSYQLESHVNAKSIKVSEKEKALEKEFESRKAEVGQKLEDLDTLQTMLAHEFLGKWQNFDWDKARAEDPDVNMKWMEYQQELAKFQTLHQKVNVEKQTQIDEQSKTNEASLITKAETLQQLFPEWNKKEIIETHHKGIKDFLMNLEFNGVPIKYSEEEASDIWDPRFYPIIHMAMQFQALQKESPKLTKRVKEAPTGIKAKRRIVNKNAKRNAARDKKIKQGDETAFLSALEEQFTAELKQ